MGARPDRRDDLFRLGGGEHELEVRRRFLDQLEEGVEALPGHHVRFVDDVDLEPAGDRRVERPLTQIPGVIHAAVRRGVDLDHVEAARPVRSQRDAGLALAARVRGRPLGAVQRAGQDPGAGRLAAAPRPAEQIGVVHPAGAQRLAERLGDVVLAAHLGERRGPVAAVERQPGRRPTGPVRVHRNGALRACARGLCCPGRARLACALAGLDPPLAGRGKGPPAHPPEPAYPCCLPALGELAG